jgi:hypothetical protein
MQVGSLKEIKVEGNQALKKSVANSSHKYGADLDTALLEKALLIICR